MSAAQSRVVADRYRLVEPLGQGGMGRVWKARDELLHRDVALKELMPPPGLTDEERQEMRERAMREARAIARLSHPNVVRIFDILRTEGEPWIVMEYVASRSLQDVLAQDGPLPVRRVADIGLGMLAALRAAHLRGVVHRDVKPGNVLLGDDGRVVLTDFGLATVPGDPVVTRTGLVLGSPAYIAPERAHDGTAAPAADMWSLGATLYAAVEGQSPYARPSAIATLTALATEPPGPARHAGALKPVLNGLLRKDPADRIKVEEVERLLRRAAGRKSKSRSGVSLLPGVRRPLADGYLPTSRPAPVAAAAVVPPPRRPSGAGPVDRVDAPPEPAPPADQAKAPVEPSPPAAVPAAEASPAEPAPPVAADGPAAVATADPEPDQRADQAAAEPGAAAAAVGQTAVEQGGVGHDPAVDGRGPVAAEAGSGTDPAPVDQSEPALVRTPWKVTGRAVVPAVPEVLKRRPVWWLGGAAMVVVLAVVLTIVLSNGDRAQDPQNPRGQGAAGPTVSPAGGGSEAPAATATAAPTTPPAPAATVAPAGGNLTLPAGWHIHNDPTGFSVAVPRAWREDRDGTIVYFREQTGERRVLGIDRSDTPKSDPVADWTAQEAQRSHTKRNYERVRIEKVDYFIAAADWEYTYDGSARLHAINRGFVTGPEQAHAILWITPDRTWTQNLDEFELITGSFKPIP